jgi:hypothetical protein
LGALKACVVESAIVEGAKGMFAHPSVVIGVVANGVKKDVLSIVVFEGYKLADLQSLWKGA